MVAREKYRKFRKKLKNQVIFSILAIFEVENVKKCIFWPSEGSNIWAITFYYCVIKIELDFSMDYMMPNLPQPGAQLTPNTGQVGHFDQHFWKVYRDQSIYLFLSNLHDYVAQTPNCCSCSILHLEIQAQLKKMSNMQKSAQLTPTSPTLDESIF